MLKKILKTAVMIPLYVGLSYSNVDAKILKSGDSGGPKLRNLQESIFDSTNTNAKPKGIWGPVTYRAFDKYIKRNRINIDETISSNKVDTKALHNLELVVKQNGDFQELYKKKEDISYYNFKNILENQNVSKEIIDSMWSGAKNANIGAIATAAIIGVESDYNPNAVSPSGNHLGLGQISKGAKDLVCEWYDKDNKYECNQMDLFNPNTNAEITAKHIRILMQELETNDARIIYLAHNQGLNKVQKEMGKYNNDADLVWKNIKMTDKKNNPKDVIEKRLDHYFQMFGSEPIVENSYERIR